MPKIIANLSQDELIDSFFDNSQPNQEAPRAVIIMGGVGSGKTTMRKNEFASGYVQIDGSDIFSKIVKEESADDLDQYLPTIDEIGQQIMHRAVKERRNLAIEHIGDDASEMESIVDKLNEIGYQVDLRFVDCDTTEAYLRHLKATDSDYHYLSCYFTKDLHTKWILNAFQKLF